MATPLPQKVTTSSQVICQELDGEMVILDLQQEQYFGLNEAGTRMWQLMSDGCPTDQIVGMMQSEFDVDENTVRADLADLIDKLVKANLLKRAA